MATATKKTTKTTTAKPAAKKTTTAKKTATKKTTTAKLTAKEIMAMLKSKYDEVYDDGGVYSIKHNGKWGFADASGIVKIKPCYTGIETDWTEDIMTTWGAGGVGFINKKLEEISKPQFSAAGNFKKGVAAVKQKTGKWGFIDKKGKTVVPFVFDNIISLSGGKFQVEVGPFVFITK